MIGSKKLSKVRRELQHGLNTTGEDPLRWLEALMADPERQGLASAGASDVQRSLRRFLEAPGRGKGGNKRAGVRK